MNIPSFFLCAYVRIKLVRVGHPARLLPQILDSALDAQVFTITETIIFFIFVVQ